MGYIESDYAPLVELYEASKKKAMQYVVTGKTGPLGAAADRYGKYIPCYYAGYKTRYAFYIRDYAHQDMGASLLGLHEENYRMMKAFADHCTERRQWFTVWALNFDGSEYDGDYRNDDDFIREIPSMFELVETAYRLYRWTGDKRYIDDDMFKFYTHVMVDFVELFDKDGNGIPESTGTSGNIEDGVTCTYDERGFVHLKESGDEIGCMYQAMLAYAGICDARGDEAAYDLWMKKAEELKRYFNDEWSVKDGDKNGLYVHGIDFDGNKYDYYKLETSYFMALKQVLDGGQRAQNFLSHINELQGKGIGSETANSNIEGYTYWPWLNFAYGRCEDGWNWMKYIFSQWNLPHESYRQGPCWYYPELSYTMLSNTVNGLMGLEPDVPNGMISSLSRLPDEIRYLTLQEQEIGGNVIELMHTGRDLSTMRNLEGDTFIWRACFYGNAEYLQVDSEQVKAEHTVINGIDVSYVDVEVKPYGLHTVMNR